MQNKDVANLNVLLPYFSLYDFNNKEASLNNYVRRMFTRTNKMFKYKKIPKKILKKIKFIEYILQVRGHIGIVEHNGNLYALEGQFGDGFDEFMFPTHYIINCPALNLSKTYEIGVDCVVIFNDSMLQGLSDMFRRYATLLVENDISLKMVDINSRMINALSAGNEQTQKSAKEFLSSIEKGELGIILDPEFLSETTGLKSTQTNQKSTNDIISLIEFEQYIKGSWFMEIGVKAPFNMKREALGDSENGLQDQSLLPLVDDMTICRQNGWLEVYELFPNYFEEGEPEVLLNGAWETTHEDENHEGETEENIDIVDEEQKEELIDKQIEEQQEDIVEDEEGEKDDEQEQKED